MNVYIYRNYVTNDQDKMNDKIFELLAQDTKSISRVEAMVEDEWSNVEEEQCSCKGLFDLMDNGYVFLNHIGTK